MNSHPAGPAAVGLAALALLAGCAGTSASVTNQWAAGASHDQAFARVLVVGVSADADQRCEFEQFMASQLASPATQVFQSCNAASFVSPPTRASIEQAVKETGANAVLASMLTAVSAAAKSGGTMDTRGGDYFKAEGSAIGTVPTLVGPVGVTVIYGQDENIPSVELVDGGAHVMARLYAVQGQALVCTVDAVVKNVTETDVGMTEIAEGIANRLRKDKLVQ